MTATTFAGHVQGQFTVPSGITISVTTNAGGPTSVPITAGAYFMDDFLVQLDADLESGQTVSGGNWVVTMSTGAGGTGLVTIAVTNGTFSITWTSTILRNLLGYTSNISAQTSSTGGLVPYGLWMPDCPMYVEGGHLDAAPLTTDLRQSMTPTGRVFGHVGNVKYQHAGVRWSHCPSHKVWSIDASPSTESFETFWTSVIVGQGHTWFTPSSKLKIIAHTDNWLGESYVSGWYLSGGVSFSSLVTRAVDGWDGLWSVSFGSLTTDS